MKHLSAEPDTTGIPEPFATVIKKAMAKDPAERYASVQEMVEAVFGAEHVRESVSVFSPEDLSIVAEHVARNIPAMAAVGAAGSGSGTAPPLAAGTADRWGRRDGAAGSSATIGGPGTRGDFWQRMGNLVDRVVYDDQQPPSPGVLPCARGRPCAAPGCRRRCRCRSTRQWSIRSVPASAAPWRCSSRSWRRSRPACCSWTPSRGPAGPILFTLGMSLAGAVRSCSPAAVFCRASRGSPDRCRDCSRR